MDLNDLRKSPHWSYSALSTYLNCSLQYYFRYIEQTGPERVPVCFSFGRAFHAALSHFVMNGTKATQVFSDIFSSEVAATENLVYKQGQDFNSMCELADRMLGVVFDEWQDTCSVKGVAVPFKIEIPGLSKPLIGEYDLLLEDGDSTIIVDWKTAASKWSASKAGRDIQATAFCYAYTKEHGENPLFRFDVVTKTKRPGFQRHWTTRTEDDFRRFELLAKRVDEAVNKEVFLPCVTSFSCTACSYANKCKNWR